MSERGRGDVGEEVREGIIVKEGSKRKREGYERGFKRGVRVREGE